MNNYEITINNVKRACFLHCAIARFVLFIRQCSASRSFYGKQQCRLLGYDSGRRRLRRLARQLHFAGGYSGNNGDDNPEILSFSVINNSGNNFIGDSPGDSNAINIQVSYQMSDIRDQNPLLGILQHNGGGTLSHGLLAGSLAINADDNAKAVNPVDNLPLLTSGQRGFMPRISSGGVDICANKFNAAPTAPSVSVSY